MKRFIALFLSTGLLLGGCTPVKMPVAKEYSLTAYSSKQYLAKPSKTTLLITHPEAVAGYETGLMFYRKTPFQAQSFTKNAWIHPPADMLYPLLIQSLQKTGYFYAIASSPHRTKADYRLDTQLLTLEQNFLKKPSVLELTVKVVLTRMEDDQVLASRILSQEVPCPSDTPYGGVLAANRAAFLWTLALSEFVVSRIQ